MIVAVQKADDLVNVERRAVDGMNGNPRHRHGHGCDGRDGETNPCLQPETLNQLDRQHADERHRHQSRPKGEALEGEDLIGTAQQDLADRSCPAQAKKRGHVPTEQQRAQATYGRAPHQDVRNRQDQGAHGNDPEIDPAKGLQDVVIARAVRNRHLGDWIFQERHPIRPQHDGHADDSNDCEYHGAAKN